MSEESQKKYPEHNNFAVFYFYLQGIGSLLGWNAVLTALDFFAEKFPFAKVYFTFSLPKFAANLLFCPLMVQIARKFTLNQRVSGGLILIGIFLLLLPAVGELMANGIGYGITLVILFILGGLNGISCSSVVGFAANFPHFYMAKLMAGSGIAGLILNATRAVCLAIFGSQDGLLESTALYFILSAVMSVGCAMVHQSFVKTEFSQYWSKRGDVNHVVFDEIDAFHQNHIEENNLSNRLVKVTDGQVTDSDNSMLGSSSAVPSKMPPTLLGVMKEMWIYGALLVLLYVQTFMLFPGVSLSRTIGDLDSAWNAVVVITTFNLFDTIGKTIAEKRSLFNKYSVIVVLVIRFVFFATFINLKNNKNTNFLDSDLFAIINMALFALLNGYCTSALYTMGPEAVADHKKETAGFIMQLSLYSGIISGSFLALTLSN